MTVPPKFVVVIGASAGGMNALIELVQHLEKGKNAAYCIVLHLSRKGIGDYIVFRLKQFTSLPCTMIADGQPVERDNIYIARPNQHMVIKDDKFLLGAGPEENQWRPSIDVLFRSAAVSFNSRAIGVILSGLLDDGTSGMWAIKRSGGTCIVQDPNEAEYPDMPVSVMNSMEVDHVAPLAEIGRIIKKTIDDYKEGEEQTVPEDVIEESKIAEQTAIGIDDVSKIGEQSVFACPDCGGGLWNINGDVITRYRCHIGHAYSERDLIIKQSEAAVTTLWIALRIMEERKHLLSKLEEDKKKKGFASWAESHVENAALLHKHVDQLKEILAELQNYDTSQG